MTIQALTGTESLEELEAMIAQLDNEEGADGNNDGGQVDNLAESATATPDSNASQPTEQQEDENTPLVKNGILAKDGEHIIPFEVLEAERRNNQRIQQENEALLQRLAEAEKAQTDTEQTKRLLELRNKQLEKMGVAPSDLPENLEITDEQLDELCDNFPELGSVLSTVVAQMKVLKQHSAQPQPTAPPASAEPQANPTMDNIKANADLNAWMNEGGDKWNVALDIDDRLMAAPEWSAKPQAERFAEVARRTRAVFGETQPLANQSEKPSQSAAAQEAAAETQLPASPSTLGSSNSHEGSLIERAASMGNADLYSMMQGMTDAQIDALLAEADY